MTDGQRSRGFPAVGATLSQIWRHDPALMGHRVGGSPQRGAKGSQWRSICSDSATLRVHVGLGEGGRCRVDGVCRLHVENDTGLRARLRLSESTPRIQPDPRLELHPEDSRSTRADTSAVLCVQRRTIRGLRTGVRHQGCILTNGRNGLRGRPLRIRPDDPSVWRRTIPHLRWRIHARCRHIDTPRSTARSHPVLLAPRELKRAGARGSWWAVPPVSVAKRADTTTTLKRKQPKPS